MLFVVVLVFLVQCASQTSLPESQSQAGVKDTSKADVTPSLETTLQQPGTGRQGLIYYSRRKNSEGIVTDGLYLLNLETGVEQYLTPEQTMSEYNSISWSPITKQLIYTAGEGMDEDDLYLTDLENHQIPLTRNNVQDINAKWSPDGKLLAFYSRRRDDNLLDLYLMNPDGSNVHPFFEDETILGGSIAWSPDNQFLAVSAIPYWDGQGNYPEGEELRIVDVNTKNTLLRLADDRVYVQLDWSNDGHKLAYVSDFEIQQNRSVFRKLYVLDIETGIETEVAAFDSVGWPQWSPTGDVIAFSGSMFDEDKHNLYLVKSDGTGLKQLTDGGYFSRGTWSPDGQKLAITSHGEAYTEAEIYILDVESGEMERVTDNDVHDAYPLWIEY